MPVRLPGSKFNRIKATLLPLWENNNVFFHERLKERVDYTEGRDQLFAFSQDALGHDDFPDALCGAVEQLCEVTKNSFDSTYHGAVDIETPW